MPFNIKRLLEFTILREQESVTLYTTLAKQATDVELKNLFKDLAEQEKKHARFYEETITQLGHDIVSAPLDLEDEYTIYMRSLMEEQSASLEITSEHIYSMEQAFDYAIAREKNSVLFYIGLKDYVPAFAKPTLDLIIGEEMKHAAILTRFKSRKT